MSVLITIIALGIVVFIHELGHMVVAKLCGIGVYEFAVGMGPKLISKKMGETVYSIRAFPLGGFVKLAGFDDEDDKPCPKEISYYEKPIISRLSVLSAGSAMNIVLGFTIFLFVYAFAGIPRLSPVLQSVLPDAPAAAAGLLSGDRLLSIEGVSIKDVKKDFIDKIAGSAGKSLTLRYERSDKTYSIVLVPQKKSEKISKGIVGVELGYKWVKQPPLKAIQMSFISTKKNITLVFTSLKMLVTGKAAMKDLAGPIGIVQFASFSLERGFVQFLEFVAIISLSLGVINLMPFPVLDGGHIFLLIIEAVRRRRLSRKSEALVNNFGAALLISLMVFVIVNDVINWGDRIDFLRKLSNN